MSSDQIIDAWKNEDEDKTQQKEATPKNPAGPETLNDEDLEQAEGGMVGLLPPGSCLCCSC